MILPNCTSLLFFFYSLFPAFPLSDHTVSFPAPDYIAFLPLGPPASNLGPTVLPGWWRRLFSHSIMPLPRLAHCQAGRQQGSGRFPTHARHWAREVTPLPSSHQLVPRLRHLGNERAGFCDLESSFQLQQSRRVFECPSFEALSSVGK